MSPWATMWRFNRTWRNSPRMFRLHEFLATNTERLRMDEETLTSYIEFLEFMSETNKLTWKVRGCIWP